MSKRKPMSARQFKQALDDLGIKQVHAAAMLGISERPVRRYISGENEVPEPIAKLMRLALWGNLTVKQIEEA